MDLTLDLSCEVLR